MNWPLDHIASLPVILHIELAEISGRIRFGVTKGYAFLSFLEDPLTRISVRTEVGSDKYKFNDVKQLSDFITKKLKDLIHRKFVHPNSHKFRLPWPRNWWPEGTEHLFQPTAASNMDGKSSGSPAKDEAAGEGQGSESSAAGDSAKQLDEQDDKQRDKERTSFSSGAGSRAQAVANVKNKLSNSLTNWLNKANNASNSIFNSTASFGSTASPNLNPELTASPGGKLVKSGNKQIADGQRTSADLWSEKIGKTLTAFESKMIRDRHAQSLRFPKTPKQIQQQQRLPSEGHSSSSSTAGNTGIAARKPRKKAASRQRSKSLSDADTGTASGTTHHDRSRRRAASISDLSNAGMLHLAMGIISSSRSRSNSSSPLLSSSSAASTASASATSTASRTERRPSVSGIAIRGSLGRSSNANVATNSSGPKAKGRPANDAKDGGEASTAGPLPSPAATNRRFSTNGGSSSSSSSTSLGSSSKASSAMKYVSSIFNSTYNSSSSNSNSSSSANPNKDAK